MNKPIFKLVDDKGRILIPKPIRASLGIAAGDVAAITAERGAVIIKKAIVLDDQRMPPEAKQAYAETVIRELPPDKLAEVLELAVRLLKELSTPF